MSYYCFIRFKDWSLNQLISSLCSIYKYRFLHLMGHVVWVSQSKHVDKFCLAFNKELCSSSKPGVIIYTTLHNKSAITLPYTTYMLCSFLSIHPQCNKLISPVSQISTLPWCLNLISDDSWELMAKLFHLLWIGNPFQSQPQILIYWLTSGFQKFSTGTLDAYKKNLLNTRDSFFLVFGIPDEPHVMYSSTRYE